MCYVITRVASLVWTKSRVFKLAMSASNSLRFSRNVLRKDSKLSPSLSREARSFYEKVLLQNVPVTQFLLIFLMNHIEMKNSQDSKLDFEFICSIRISTDFQVMKHSLSSNLLTTE